MEEGINLNGPGGEAGNPDDAAVAEFDSEPNYRLRLRS